MQRACVSETFTKAWQVGSSEEVARAAVMWLLPGRGSNTSAQMRLSAAPVVTRELT